MKPPKQSDLEVSSMSEFVDDDRNAPRFRINREAMISQEVFEKEKALVFDRSWLYVGHASELKKKNDFKTRTVAGRPLIFTRDASGELRVWINSCPHRGAMLCRDKSGNSRFMTCFYHGWTFSNAGKMVSLPGDGSYVSTFDRPGLASPPRLEVYRDFVFISCDPDIVDLPTYLGAAAEYLDLVADQSEVGMEILEGTHEYSVKANWKLLVENSVDGYHAISVHQRYFEMVAVARGGFDAKSMADTVGLDLGNGHAAMAGGPSTHGVFGRPLTDAAVAEKDARYDRLRARHGVGWVDRMLGTRNLVIFPNLVVIDLVMGVVVRAIEPLTPDYMEVTAWELAPPEEGDELRRQRLDNFLTFWGPGGLASPDDVEALETCQRSYASVKELAWSDISRGITTPVPDSSDEVQMRAWWRRWNELVAGEVLPPEPHGPLPERWTAPREDAATVSS
jgi:p-cumate 2,3-dioxygenase alpha subunit